VPRRREPLITQRDAADVRADRDAVQAGLRDEACLVDGGRRVLEREHAERQQPVRVSTPELDEGLVLEAADLGRHGRRRIVQVGERCRGQHVGAHPGAVHRRQPRRGIPALGPDRTQGSTVPRHPEEALAVAVGLDAEPAEPAARPPGPPRRDDVRVHVHARCGGYLAHDLHAQLL
jgi:hypothetical protein